jgi:hypothetical protein
MLVLTFNQEQQMVAWTRWETDGAFTRVAVLRAGTSSTEDSVFVTVKRTVGDNTVRYNEVLHSRVFSSVKDCFFVDSGLSYDSPVTITGATSADPVVITAASHGFSNGDEIDIHDIVWAVTYDEYYNKVIPAQLNGRRYLAANVTTNTFELTDTDGTDIDGSTFSAYISGGTARVATATLAGLAHLAGEEIVALADGSVVNGLTVSSTGFVTLPRPASRIHAGLRYVSDFETLSIESPQGTIQGKRKQITGVTFRLKKSVGFVHGPDVANLHEAKIREFETMGEPVGLLTGDKRVQAEPSWNTKGRMFLRQYNPLPVTVSAAIPTITVGN